MNAQGPDALLTYAEAAGRLRCSVKTVLREVEAGKLADTSIRGKRFVLASELDAYVRRSTRTRRPPEEAPAAASSSLLKRLGVEDLAGLLPRPRGRVRPKG